MEEDPLNRSSQTTNAQAMLEQEKSKRVVGGSIFDPGAGERVQADSDRRSEIFEQDGMQGLVELAKEKNQMLGETERLKKTARLVTLRRRLSKMLRLS